MLPSIFIDGEQIRRDGAWPRHKPALLSDDGRRYYGGERPGQRLGVYGAPTRQRQQLTKPQSSAEISPLICCGGLWSLLAHHVGRALLGFMFDSEELRT